MNNKKYFSTITKFALSIMLFGCLNSVFGRQDMYFATTAKEMRFEEIFPILRAQYDAQTVIHMLKETGHLKKLTKVEIDELPNLILREELPKFPYKVINYDDMEDREARLPDLIIIPPYTIHNQHDFQDGFIILAGEKIPRGHFVTYIRTETTPTICPPGLAFKDGFLDTANVRVAKDKGFVIAIKPIDSLEQIDVSAAFFADAFLEKNGVPCFSYDSKTKSQEEKKSTR